MPAIVRTVTKIGDTHTLQEFINIGNSFPNKFDYKSFCMIEKRDGVEYPVYNVIDDYLYELKESAVEVTLSSKEKAKYIYNPKLLSEKLYGTTLWYHLILKVNNLCSVHEFNLPNNKLFLVKPNNLRQFLEKVYSSEKTAISYYNSVHKNDKDVSLVANPRI